MDLFAPAPSQASYSAPSFEDILKGVKGKHMLF